MILIFILTNLTKNNHKFCYKH